ncbi:MAG: cell division protein FtsZ [Clostridia bacterium]|nr:cell division protein FtsZ [Clostridia bacterium]
MIFEHDDSRECNVCIKIVGVGGGGNNAVNRMISSGVKGVDFITVNTDKQAFRNSLAPTQIVIGEKITKGFGAGANPLIGERSAEESIEEIKNMLTGADMVFITAGMGGGTGTGAAPVIARVAQEMDILTVGVVTKPFAFERKKRMDQAIAGIAELSKYVDSLIVVPNERLKLVSDNRITLANAFSEADDVLRRAVQSITELITATGYINLDFADVTSIMAESGLAHMGIGSATGKDKAEEAANMAISSPLLETSIKGATGVIISITASPDIVLEDVDVASSMISSQCNPDARVIFGVAFDSSLEDEMRVTIIATGFENDVNGEALNYMNPSSAAENDGAAKAEPKTANEKKPIKDASSLNLDDLFSNLF